MSAARLLFGGEQGDIWLQRARLPRRSATDASSRHMGAGKGRGVSLGINFRTNSKLHVSFYISVDCTVGALAWECMVILISSFCNVRRAKTHVCGRFRQAC